MFTKKIMGLIILTFMFSSCGQKGFESANSISPANPKEQTGQNTDDVIPGGSGGGQSPSGGSDNTKLIPDLDGFIRSNDSESRNKIAFRLDATTKEIVFSVPLPSGLIVQSSGVISSIPGSRYGTELDSNNNRIFVVRLPAAHIIDGLSNLQKGRLPNGQVLPSMPSGFGELPMAALPVQIANIAVNMRLYIEKKAMGLFIELPINKWPVSLSYPIKSKDGSKTLGYFNIVAATSTSKAGIYVSLLPSSTLVSSLKTFLQQ